MVSEAISTRAGVPIIPYTKGHAVGNVFPMRVSDGTVYNLKLPDPDYAISVDLSNVKKVQFGQVAAGSSFIYGTFATVKIELPGMGTRYLDSSFKNGETKVVPLPRPTSTTSRRTTTPGTRCSGAWPKPWPARTRPPAQGRGLCSRYRPSS